MREKRMQGGEVRQSNPASFAECNPQETEIEVLRFVAMPSFHMQRRSFPLRSSASTSPTLMTTINRHKHKRVLQVPPQQRGRTPRLGLFVLDRTLSLSRSPGRCSHHSNCTVIPCHVALRLTSAARHAANLFPANDS